MNRLRLPRSSRAILAGVAATGVSTLPDSKLSIYPAPPAVLVLEETPSALEAHIGAARRTATAFALDAHAQVQGVVSRWIGVEEAVESRVKSLLAPEEPLTPGILYVAVAALTGSILARGRRLPTRLVLPPALLLASANHFLPKTSANVAAYAGELEGRYVPALKEKQDIGRAHAAMTWERVKESTKDGREGAGRAAEGLVRRVQESTGLKLRETLGWGEAKVQEAEGVVVKAVEAVKEKAAEAKEGVDAKVEQAKEVVDVKVKEVKDGVDTQVEKAEEGADAKVKEAQPKRLV